MPPRHSTSSTKTTGAVYTPADVAKALARYATRGQQSRSTSVLEPSVGDGSFVRGIEESGLDVERLVLVDVDEAALFALKETLPARFENASVFLHQSFLAYGNQQDQRPFDIVLGNPPFIRRHNFSDALKGEVARLAEVLSVPASELKNTWAAFLSLASSLVAEDGVLALVLPYELLTVNYGRAALKRVADEFQRVEIFIPTEKAFAHIEQDAVALVAHKSSSEKGVFLRRVKTLAELDDSTSVKASVRGEDASLSLNSFLVPSDTIELARRLQKEIPTASSLLTCAPGVVSAANDFFILSRSDVEKMHAEAWVVPIVKNGAQVSGLVRLDAGAFERIAQHEDAYLLNIGTQDPRLLPKEIRDYLNVGKRLLVHQRYKCRHRTPWYHVPMVEMAPAFLLRRAHSHPRIVLNDANVLTTDTAYGIRPEGDATAEGIWFSFYNSLTFLFSEVDGRFYGGGVLELTPKEFRSLPIPYAKPTSSEVTRLEKAALGSRDGMQLVQLGDQGLGARIGLTEIQIAKLQNGWLALREHRLRHSSRRARPD